MATKQDLLDRIASLEDELSEYQEREDALLDVLGVDSGEDDDELISDDED